MLLPPGPSPWEVFDCGSWTMGLGSAPSRPPPVLSQPPRNVPLSAPPRAAIDCLLNSRRFNIFDPIRHHLPLRVDETTAFGKELALSLSETNMPLGSPIRARRVKSVLWSIYSKSMRGDNRGTLRMLRLEQKPRGRRWRCGRKLPLLDSAQTRGLQSAQLGLGA